VSRFLKDNNTDFQVSETNGIWTLTITKTAIELSHPNEEVTVLRMYHILRKVILWLSFPPIRWERAIANLGIC